MPEKRAGREGSRNAAVDADRRTRVSPGRGRPPKFGRPSQVVAITLPQDVLDSLTTLHRDIGWAIVRLVESTLGEGEGKRPSPPHAPAELVHLPGGRALIVVQPEAFRRLPGISTIPLADGRAFLAFDHGGALADLEVAIVDALEAAPTHGKRRADLAQVRDIVRTWRRDRRLAFRTKSIIVVEGLAGAAPRELAPLENVRGSRRRSGNHGARPRRT